MMKRSAFALLALAALLLPALLTRGGDGVVAQAAGPAFAETAVTYYLDSGSDGSTTAIAIGTPSFTAGTVSGGTDTCSEAVNGEYQNGSADPANFIAVGGTGTGTSVLSVAGNCAITYTGAASASTRAASTLEAYSLTVTIGDGQGTDPDDTLQVTVKLVDAHTDRAALIAFRAATDGANWGDSTNWGTGTIASNADIHTFDLTAATGSGFTGYHADRNPALGAIRNMSGTATVNGTDYDLALLNSSPSSATTYRFAFAVRPTTRAAADFQCHTLAVGPTGSATSVAFDSASVTGTQSGGTSGNRYEWRWETAGTNPSPITTGNDFKADLKGPRTFGDWYGVDATCGRAADLHLRGNGLSGTLPAVLAELTALTSLDLSGNAGLTGDIPAALLAHTGLVNLDLSGTAICVDSTDTAANDWLAAIRARSGGSAIVPICGLFGTTFAEDAITLAIDEGANGTVTPVTAGAAAFIHGTAGGTDVCAVSAYANPSDDPTEFIEAGTADATAVSVFAATVNAADDACIITFTGAAPRSTRTAGMLEAYSLTVTVSDNVSARDTVRVTVKILNEETDREALDALYDATGGASWTNNDNWNTGPVSEDVTVHTFELTSHTGAVGGQNGFRTASAGGVGGSVRNSSDTVTLGGTAYTLVQLTASFAAAPPANSRIVMGVTPVTGVPAAFQCHSLEVGTPASTVSFDSGTASAGPTGAGASRRYQWRWEGVGPQRAAGSDLIGQNVNFEAELKGVRTFGDWDGVSAAGCGRATALALGGNGLTGTLPADLGDLTTVVSLDLSDNALTGAIPAALARMTALVSLDLSGNAGLTGSIPAALLAHTGLLSIDLRGTAVCVETTDTAVNGWLAGIRAKAGGSALAPVCGAVGPSFQRETATLTLDEGAAGATTPVAVGVARFSRGTSGGAETCSVSATNGQYANPSANPANFIEPDTAGATAVSLFAAAPASDTAACAITYTGAASASERTAGTLEAYSLTITVSDGVDSAGGTDASADDTIRVTVKIVNADTDRAALLAFYNAAGGSGWANSANWNSASGGTDRLVHTFKLTAATAAEIPPYTGFNSTASVGAARDGSDRVTLGGTEYRLLALYLGGSDGQQVTFIASPLAAAGGLRCYHLQIGSTRLAFADALVTPSPSFVTWQWGSQSSSLIGVGDFEAELRSTATFGNWAGVRTDDCGRVTWLCPLGCYSDVTNTLAGTLPRELGDLSKLQHLELRGTGLTGTIPPELGNLRDLRQLWIIGTGMSGAIPPELASLGQLTRLHLHDNSLTGAIPDLRGMSRLRTFYAFNNRLTGLPPSGGDAVTNAEQWRWRANCHPQQWRQSAGLVDTEAQAQASIDAWIAANCTIRGLTSVSSMSIASYGWSATCDHGPLTSTGTGYPSRALALGSAREWIADCPAHWPSNLGDLRLSNNRITGESPELSSLTGLRYLYLDNNLLTTFPVHWPRGLWGLFLNDNAITGSIPTSMSVLGDLVDLNLSNNQLSGPIPGAIQLLSQLQRLWLNGNAISGPIQNFGTLQRLRQLYLNDNQLEGAIPSNINLLRNLTHLDLRNNRLTGTIPATLNSLTALDTLDLSGNDLEGATPDLTDTRMAYLSLADNRLTLLPSSLGQLDRLLELHLGGNRFAEGLPDLSTATSLKRLTLGGNQFSGGIPAWMSTLTALTQLDLGDNKLTGTVPNSLAQLTAMRQLDLSENRLTCVSSSTLRSWINGIRSAGGTASVYVCPVTPPGGGVVVPPPVVPGGPGPGDGGVVPPPVVVAPRGGDLPSNYIRITIETEGDAPRGSVYGLRVVCGGSSYAVERRAGEEYIAGVTPGGICSLTVTNRQGASEVRGTFADERFEEGVTNAIVTFVYAAPPPADAPTPGEELEARVVVGGAFARWTGESTPVGEVVDGFALRVTAVYRWDAAAQEWRSWFPGGEALGVNTLATLEPGGIYSIYARER